MPRHKQNGGGTAVLEPKTQGLSTREALRLVYAVEDAIAAVVRMRPKDKATRQALKKIAAVREDLEDRFDNEEADKALQEPGSIPYETIRKELGL